MSVKKTSGKKVVVSKASKVLRDGRASIKRKSLIAGSTLSKKESTGTTGTGPRNSWVKKKDKNDE